jgi:hypothetical protein
MGGGGWQVCILKSQAAVTPGLHRVDANNQFKRKEVQPGVPRPVYLQCSSPPDCRLNQPWVTRSLRHRRSATKSSKGLGSADGEGEGLPPGCYLGWHSIIMWPGGVPEEKK